MIPSTLPTDIDIVPEPGGTLTFEQSFALMSEASFRGRVQVACLAYAQYITLEPTGAPAHNSRLRWAASVYQNPVFVSGQVTPPTVMNPNVQQDGSAISDASLQAAVQAVVDEML
jgi:hypothetical protein